MFRPLNPIGRPQVEHEQLFPGRQTYARYLHVAETVAEDEAQAAWDGLGGRLKALRREVVDVRAGQSKAEAGQAEAKADMEKMKAGQAEAKTDMEEVKADVAEVKADVAQVQADVSELKTGQVEVKALLEKLVAQSLQNMA
jgi:chromosome segregation ATPase